ncbi:putative Transcriptional regulator, GntR family [Candidatus Sulfobium mesophilum]|uniref:Putative Transcriptional regulator, GntR family n=1 Tax=Candidatus Sulfobium mesophilum TaxID=2016548 RepID=A0A2U3QKI4_9BACT|nr:putative Transcriptional regulator, GntR family [Candidatus Sulfobium mesophilum]
MMQNETDVLQIKTVDRYNQEKLYIQLTRIFLEEITASRWGLGQKIPTEEDLCRKYAVSKITVRQAINNLVSDGYLMKFQGKGTFVTSVLPVVGLSMRTRFTEEMFGEEVKVEKEILFKGIQAPPEDVRAYLKTEDSIYFVLCKRTVNGEPAYLDESFIPYHMLPGIEQIDFTHDSLYYILQEKGLKKIFKVIQTIEVLQAWGESARYLDITQGVPVLAVHRLLLSSDNTPVGYTRFLGRSDRYKFQTEFERIR